MRPNGAGLGEEHLTNIKKYVIIYKKNCFTVRAPHIRAFNRGRPHIILLSWTGCSGAFKKLSRHMGCSLRSPLFWTGPSGGIISVAERIVAGHFSGNLGRIWKSLEVAENLHMGYPVGNSGPDVRPGPGSFRKSADLTQSAQSARKIVISHN